MERLNPGATLCSIGTTHPLNAAGVGRDAVTFAEFGFATTTVVTAVSAQDDGGVRAVHAIPAEVVNAQLAALPAGLRGVCIGALGGPSVRPVADFLRRHPDVPAVFDPVLRATLGGTLMDADTLDAVRPRLFAHCTVVTPNAGEAAEIAGSEVAGLDGACAAAARIRAFGARAVLVTGVPAGGEIADLLLDAERRTVMRSPRSGIDLRGGGSLLAAALTAQLAMGRELTAAVRVAREYVASKRRERELSGSGVPS